MPEFNQYQRRQLFSYYDLSHTLTECSKQAIVTCIRHLMRKVRPDYLYPVLNVLNSSITDHRLQALSSFAASVTRDNATPAVEAIDVVNMPMLRTGMYYRVFNYGLFAEISLMATSWAYSHLLSSDFECVIPENTKYAVRDGNGLSLLTIVDFEHIPVPTRSSLSIDASWFPWITYTSLPDTSYEKVNVYKLRQQFVRKRLRNFVDNAPSTDCISNTLDSYFIRMGDKVGLESPKLDVDIVSWDVCKFWKGTNIVLLGDDNAFCDLVAKRVNKFLNSNVCKSSYLHYRSQGYDNSQFNKDESLTARENMAFNFACLVKSKRFSGDIQCNLVQVAALFSDSHVTTPLNWLSSH
jgi:hypothetical protein